MKEIPSDVFDQLAECLQWYVENDDVNLGDPDNEYWITGYANAVKLLVKLGYLSADDFEFDD